MFQYPSLQLEMPDAIQNILGNFWDVFYGDRDTVNSYCAAKGEIELQTYQDLNDAATACGIATCPVYRRVRRLPLVIKQSEMYYQDGVYRVEAPPGLAKVNVICDQVSIGSVVWIRGVDYTFDGTLLLFQQNPFTAGFPVTAPYDSSGNFLDNQVTMWLFQAEVDTDMLYEHFGSIIGLRLKSSISYKKLLNAAWNALVRGTSREDIEQALAALADVPLVERDGEVVTHVIHDKDDLLVITDQTVYRFSSNANPVVGVGSTLAQGQTLTDVVRLHDMSAGQLPQLGSLSIGVGLLDPSIAAPVSFRNADVPLQVTTAADGHTVASFALEGDAAAIDQFWTLMDQKGVASGHTLAKAMDTRTNKTGEPTADNLPKTVNPMRFLIQNVFRHNGLLAIIRPEAFGPEAIGLAQFHLLRRMMSPHQAVIPVQLTTAGDGITMNGLT